MKGLAFVLLFTAMTFFAWGAYGPVLHHGTQALANDALRAFVGVGLAYFLIAVLIPMLFLKSSKEAGHWTVSGVVYSLVAGAVGALGALGIILALGYGGETVYIMPLVFGFAPVVNTLVTAAISKTFGQIRPIFIIGILTAALGAVGVLTFRSQGAAATSPNPDKSPDSATTAALTATSYPTITPASYELALQNSQAEQSTAEPPDSASNAPAPAPDSAAAAPATKKNSTKDSSSDQLAENSQTQVPAGKPKNVSGIVFSILLAAVCWGSYGPMLHIGQGKMSGSRLRPFMCVGIAYFLIAVLVPLYLIQSRANDTGNWTMNGMTWAFFAGVAGAIGALGVILAFNAGGKPFYVMPLIFGFAPVINTFISLSEKGTWHLVHPLFWVSLIVVIAGAVTVLITAPKPQPKTKPVAG